MDGCWFIDAHRVPSIAFVLQLWLYNQRRSRKSGSVPSPGIWLLFWVGSFLLSRMRKWAFTVYHHVHNWGIKRVAPFISVLRSTLVIISGFWGNVVGITSYLLLTPPACSCESWSRSFGFHEQASKFQLARKPDFAKDQKMGAFLLRGVQLNCWLVKTMLATQLILQPLLFPQYCRSHWTNYLSGPESSFCMD